MQNDGAAIRSKCKRYRNPQEIKVTKKIGNVNEAQHRGKQARKEIKKANIAREAVRKAAARAKYRNAVKGQAKMQ
ncbi:MAG: hypothetical protein JWR25_154 [Noviherbaspirillum sp.]|nr:hypothetical protein [Noviherbaspirillum sp.]